MTRTIARICLLVTLPAHVATQNRTVVIDGVPTTCTAAVELRNSDMFSRYTVALGKYEKSQARYDRAVKLFEARLQKAAKQWQKAAEAEKKRIIADLLISLAGATAAKYLPRAVPDGLSNADQTMLEGAVSRLESAAEVAVGAAFGDEIEARATYLKLAYPLLLASAAAFAPAVAPVAATLSVISKGAELGGRIFDVLVLAYQANREITGLAEAMRQTVSRSPRADLVALNKVKDSIDSACGMR